MKKLILSFALIALCSCGFKPLYVEKKGEDSWYFGGDFDQSISHEMSQIKIEYIKDRFGQMIRNNLLDSLTPKGEPDNPKYILSVQPDQPEIVQQALRTDTTATRERVRQRVRYVMKSSDGTVLFGNDSIAYSGYDILINPYSTTMARRKADENTAKIIADDITLRVGAYFHGMTSYTYGGEKIDF